MNNNVAIIGSGSWGTALGIHLANKGLNVKVWSFSEDEAKMMNEDRKSAFLPNVVIPENMQCYTGFEDVLRDVELVIHVTPSKFFRDTVKKYKEYINENHVIVICSKGFESNTLMTLDDVLKEELPNNKIGVLSGPSHAEEVSIEIPTALVAASEDEYVNDLVRETFKSNKLRIYTSKDVKGVELGGALKNIIAFCAGMSVGLNLGDNTFAALATRGLVEIARLGTALGGNEKTFYGLSGLGDLIVTCNSMHSRNRRAGMAIGQGKTLDQARQEIGQVIESVDNIEVAYKLSKKMNIEMPIVDTVYNILYNGLDPKEAVNMLMTRDLKEE